ncbi:MAG TPA: class I SAM-dependent methyltransferase [Acidimicrobiales bacterium]|nr:class I SAM-dependent methyltransferase [Acidimicrobiales bacterium]
MEPDRGQNPWLGTDAPRGAAYDERFARLAAEGHDVHGEAALVASLGLGSVLDAGCGTGRVALELSRRGLDVVGVDLDAAMLGVAREKAPLIRWVHADLVDVDLGRRFDGIVMAGNVMIFVTPGTEGAVLANMARHLEVGGLLVAGFSLGAGRLTLETYDELAAATGLERAERWADWHRTPFTSGADYAVSIHRRR